MNMMVIGKRNSKMSAEEREYQTRCDMRTLREAEEIKKDARRHSAARSAAAEEMKSLEKVVKPTQKTKPTRRTNRG